MCVVVSERLEGRNSQDVLLGSASKCSKLRGAWRATHNISIMCAGDLPGIQHMHRDVWQLLEPGGMRRTILSPATTNVLVASPLRYTGPRLPVKRVYLSFGSSSASSSSSSSSDSCSTLSLPLLAAGCCRDSWRTAAFGSSSFDAAAMLDA